MKTLTTDLHVHYSMVQHGSQFSKQTTVGTLKKKEICIKTVEVYNHVHPGSFCSVRAESTSRTRFSSAAASVLYLDPFSIASDLPWHGRHQDYQLWVSKIFLSESKKHVSRLFLAKCQPSPPTSKLVETIHFNIVFRSL